MTEALHVAIQRALQHFPSEVALARTLQIPRGTVKHWLDCEPGSLDYKRMDYDPAALHEALLEGVRSQGYDEGYEAGQHADVEIPESTEVEQSGDSLNTAKLLGEPVHSLEAATEYFEVNTDRWEAYKFECSYHEVPIAPRSKDGEPVKIPCYRVRVRWKRNKVREGLAAFVESLLEDEQPKEIDFPGPRPMRGDLLSVIHIPDLHLGNIIYSETAGKAWDLEKGVTQYKRAFSYLLEQAADAGAGQVGLVIGSDAAQANASDAKSANGTQYSQTAPSKLVFRAMGQLYIWSIKQALRHCEVIAWGVSGNHDYDPADNCAVGLSWKFGDVRHVTVDASPQDIKFHQHGTTFLGLAHGKTRGKKTWKPQDYYNYYTDTHSDAWHATQYREVLTGHLHSRSAGRPGDYVSHHSLLVRVSPTLCPPTAWEIRNGYSGALRAAEVYHYHPETGLYGHHTYAPELMET